MLMKKVENILNLTFVFINLYFVSLISIFYVTNYLGIASHYPEPKDKKKFIESQMYDFNYDNPLPPKYKWPEETEPIKSKSIHDLTGDHLKKH